MGSTKPNVTKKLLPNILNLHKLDVFFEDKDNDIFQIDGLDDYLSYRKVDWILWTFWYGSQKLSGYSKLLWG